MTQQDEDPLLITLHELGQCMPGLRLHLEEAVGLTNAMLNEAPGEAISADLGDVTRKLERLKVVISTAVAFSEVVWMGISNLRSSAGLSSGEQQRPEYIDVKQIVDECRDVYILRMGSESDMEYRYKWDGPSIIFGIETELRRVFMNIMDNAQKYSFRPAGAAKRFVSINGRGSEGASWVKVRITNYGVGVLEQEWPSVLLQGVRGRLAREDLRVGSGLGLSEASRICRRHGGALSMRSVPASDAASEESVINVLQSNKREALRIPWITTVVVTLKGVPVQENWR